MNKLEWFSYRCEKKWIYKDKGTDREKIQWHFEPHFESNHYGNEDMGLDALIKGGFEICHESFGKL